MALNVPPNLPANFNVTLLNNTDLCTFQTCPLSLAHVGYDPNLAGNVLYIAIFALALAAQVLFAIKYRIWGYGIAMFGGLLLEIVGYVARVQMHYHPFAKTPFLMYLVCLTMGPAFLSAAIYLCISRIVVVYSESVSRFRPATYTLIFITCDFLALLLQAAGGGIAASAYTVSMDNTGKWIMVAGVSWQVFSLVLFAVVCADFFLRVRKASPVEMNPAFATFRMTKSFRFFLWSLGVSTVTVFTRSVFRVAELSGGFHGKLAQQQITFMILEGGMISIASISLTVFHPGLIFGPNWESASWTIRSKLSKNADDFTTDSHPISGGEAHQLHGMSYNTTKLSDATVQPNV
ncbi:phospholipid-translocating ATPase rsb1 [Elasticomyces elasticus]|uniref:Phospholipid-translocating ATPase rsb1 n=1 Tax=Exophiala sideris TaxID=1016849 RepID=A0ABR0IV34_9EURO|nr:phospholipid-translocating ATPase rsb1 [Elasticomyces elasticus]KAK5021284.1 phospholipid-translocating ATPase rsb1 [Exophiala sideris]KAK5024245.1 phospholipid-translocating ATPase rsb1 [Exophiala sideris]KAK5049187.1 phospholipid-translocating ATPase rsb1 [Exophiala sideris]KAK5176498.1 phospholipid-translocating ATPase rsb1 [Eurotiomycetes sp. CCFEE 6388]